MVTFTRSPHPVPEKKEKKKKTDEDHISILFSFVKTHCVTLICIQN